MLKFLTVFVGLLALRTVSTAEELVAKINLTVQAVPPPPRTRSDLLWVTHVNSQTYTFDCRPDGHRFCETEDYEAAKKGKRRPDNLLFKVYESKEIDDKFSDEKKYIDKTVKKIGDDVRTIVVSALKEVTPKLFTSEIKEQMVAEIAVKLENTLQERLNAERIDRKHAIEALDARIRSLEARRADQ
jgi:hypothetical protein